MKTLLLSLFIASSMFTSLAHADDIFWVLLYPRLSYQDSTFSCSYKYSPLRPFYLSVVVQPNMKAKTAELRDEAQLPLLKLKLNEKELEGLEIIKDAVGDYRIKKMLLPERLLVWFAFYSDSAGADLFGCRPPKYFATIGPNSSTFTFEYKDASTYVSPEQKFEGILVDRKPYEMKLGFTQTPVATP